MIHPALRPRVAAATIASDLGGRSDAPTFAELVNAAWQSGANPVRHLPQIARLLRALANPVGRAPLAPSAGRFTAGYRRTNKLCGTVLYGAPLGFVVYVVTELANQSGYAGVLDPAFAAAGPAFAASIIGLTVLYKEDGRAE